MQQEKESEEKGRTIVEIRWRDCFKFWVAGLILAWLPIIVILVLVLMAGGS